MEVGGFSVWSEFCRVALTEKCQTLESELRERDPVEFARIYGKNSSTVDRRDHSSDGRDHSSGRRDHSSDRGNHS
jgi:hypothetical protein